MLVPGNEVGAVVEGGLWSVLSMAAVVTNPFLKAGGHATPFQQT